MAEASGMSTLGNPGRPPAAAAMPDPVDLLLQAFQDPATYRRLVGRLRPRLVGRPHPKRRLARHTGPVIRPPQVAAGTRAVLEEITG